MNQFFNARVNTRQNQPTKKILSAPPPGSSFEARAFAALFRNAKVLGIEELWRCSSARLDGFLVTVSNECILLEMKECLGFGPVQAAIFQMIAGRELLKLKAARGLIVFTRKSREWERCEPNGAWGQLQLHSEELPARVNLIVGGIQIDERNRVTGPAE